MKLKKGEISYILSIIGFAITLFMFSSGRKYYNEVFLSLGIGAIVASVIVSLMAIKSNEAGPSKYIGILIALILVMGIVVLRLLLAMDFAP